MLPKLEYPVYETKIPSNGKTVKYRPFLVKEHRMLMKAIEFNDETNLIETFKNLIKACVLTDVDVDKLAMFDVDWLYLKIKGVSTGSVNQVKYKCNHVGADGAACGNSVLVNLDTEQAVLNVPDSLNTIMVGKDVGVKMRYPTFEDYIRNGRAQSLIELTEEFVLDCIESVFDKEAIYTPGVDFTREDLREFVNGFTNEASEKITEFVENIPQLEMKMDIRCPKCGNHDVIHLRGIDDFLE